MHDFLDIPCQRGDGPSFLVRLARDLQQIHMACLGLPLFTAGASIWPIRFAIKSMDFGEQRAGMSCDLPGQFQGANYDPRASSA